MITGQLFNFVIREINYTALVQRSKSVADSMYHFYNVSTFIDHDKFNSAHKKHRVMFAGWLDTVDPANVSPIAVIDVTLNSLCAYIIRSKCVRLNRGHFHAINDNDDYRNANFDIMYYLHLDYPTEIFALRLWSEVFHEIVARATGNTLIKKFVIEQRCDDVERMCRALRNSPQYMHKMSKMPDYLMEMMKFHAVENEG